VRGCGHLRAGPVRFAPAPFRRANRVDCARLLCLAGAARTYARNFDWLDDRSLWTSAANVCPGSAKAHYNLGNVSKELLGGLPEAIAQYEAALRIYPEYAPAHNNLGLALADSERVCRT